MSQEPIEHASTTPGVPVAPSMGPLLEKEAMPYRGQRAGDAHLIYLTFLALIIGVVSALIAQVLIWLIGLITNIAFHGQFTAANATPLGFTMGWWVVVIPVIGGLIVGLMAKYGSQAICGHGIPEAMEQVLEHQSCIPYRITILKPLSAAIAIGTGGPFGMEGPIIATGGALGSMVGQLLPSSPDDRKALLSAGAAAGMAATFGSPISGVMMAVELLLFEFRPRSLIPVSVAAAAAGVRSLFTGSGPIFAMPAVHAAPPEALVFYVVLGLIVGLFSIVATQAVYLSTDFFLHTRIPWMWWAAIGAIPVGVIGYFNPHTLGVGYDNIREILTGSITLQAVIWLAVLKCASWAFSLGSGTSGGTLAPLFTIGGGAGLAVGWGLGKLFPGSGIDLHIAAMVGMGAMFAGASRALLTSIVFVVETTLEAHALAPLVLGCSAAYLISALLMRETIMTAKIARKGIHVPTEYLSDPLERALVKEAMTRHPTTLKAEQSVESARQWLGGGGPDTDHYAFPVVDEAGMARGIVTRRDLARPEAAGKTVGQAATRQMLTIAPDAPLSRAQYMMVHYDIGRLPVVDAQGKLLGLLSRNDVLGAAHPDWRPSGRPPQPPVGHPALPRRRGRG